ncbi:hypothetical protein [Microbacterium sp. MYb62]|uniref:hypothetical protein n=1 Tax=Microbacterium sp. MYb62 TaxID=1848690 RepID=UPI002157D205|nr:hypothetical protein [Microbacterium sp. MYb62]
MRATIVLPAGSARRDLLSARGWRVIARSFGARLDAALIDRNRLTRLVRRIDGRASVRELGTDDVEAVLTLDSTTIQDYPGSVATQHAPLVRSTAEPTDRRRAFGAFEPSAFSSR